MKYKIHDDDLRNTFLLGYLFKKNMCYRVILSVTLIILFFETGCKKQDEPKIIIPIHYIQNKIIVSTVTNNSVILPIQSDTAVEIILKNNSISACNTNSHIIGMGNEPFTNDHTLDYSQILGNKITWRGTSFTDDDGGIMMWNFVNSTAKYNLLINCPYGITSKSNGLTNLQGGVAYNIFGPSFKVGAGAKGVNGMKFYNNTFYNNRNINQGTIGSVYLSSNFDVSSNDPSTNCEIYNNIFYTKYLVPNIYCDQVSLVGLKCDYNLYWCESGEPIFRIAGNTITFSDWKAKGFDVHSVIANPHFVNFNTLIPSSPLYYGTNLGETWNQGLNTSNTWQQADPILTTKYQLAGWGLHFELISSQSTSFISIFLKKNIFVT